MSIYEVLILAHLGSTAVLLVVLCTIIVVQRALEVVRGRPAPAGRYAAPPAAPAPLERPQPAPARGVAQDVLPHPARGVLRSSS